MADKAQLEVEKKAKAAAKAERKKQYEAQQAEKAKQQGGDAAGKKSKAELKAERRAKQEAQRAAKTTGDSAKSGKKSLGDNVGKKGQGDNLGKKKPLTEKQSEKSQQQESKIKKQPSSSSITKSHEQPRVSSNVQMDSEKVQKKITKTLAKQNVPQRSAAQKKVQMFAHLHQYEKDRSLTKNLSFSSCSIHPAIIKLGLQFAEGIITGSNARCISMLCALKMVIKDYSTPPQKELSRDLESKIKPCISFLTQCRNLSQSMGNAIKYLKHQITNLSPELPEAKAKEHLLESIDSFIQERIILADQQITNFAVQKIHDGNKILIYGFSSLIINILKDAKESGKEFEVVVVDCRPDFPGRETLKRLEDAEIKCSYTLLNNISYIIKEVTTVFLGTHALLANGNVMAKAGTSMVAMVAKSNNVPVLVCCETYKFCERAQSDSFVFNELGDPDDLVSLHRPHSQDILTNWRDIKSLYLLNLVYDVTPSSFVDMVVTEIGMIPCTSVPVVLRVKNTNDGIAT
eukprot:TCONS_00009735-protein